MDTFLASLLKRLADEQAKVVILYGSRARGDATPESDFDVAAFAEREGPVKQVAGQWGGGLLDLFIHPMATLTKAGPDHLHMRGGSVLVDEGGRGATFLSALDDVFTQGPAPLTDEEMAVRKAWSWKTLERARRGDVVGDYRRAWLLTTQLENYFSFRNEWYLGSKRALDHLRCVDAHTFSVFQAALAPNADMVAIEALVRLVNGPSEPASF